MKTILTLLTASIFVIGCASTKAPEQTAKAAPAALDFGDYASQTLTTRAWNALGEGRYMDAIKYTQKSAELYEAEAKKMQASLSAKPSKNIHDYWALNDVGTGYYIQGDAYMKLGKRPQALAAYKVVKDELSYAQAWDPKGWFWSPADAANPKIIMISNDF